MLLPDLHGETSRSTVCANGKQNGKFHLRLVSTTCKFALIYTEIAWN